MKTRSIPRNFTWVSIGILFSVVFFSAKVLASSIEASQDELAERSDLVISGVVVGESSYREPSFLVDIESLDEKRKPITRVENWNQILTDFKIDVSSVISGNYDESKIHLTVIGGTVGNKSTSYSSSFGLAQGRKYILFLGYEKRNDKWWAVAGRQGVFEEVVTGSNVFRTINGERTTVEQLKSRIRESTHEK